MVHYSYSMIRMKFVKKTISIREDQAEWIEANTISLSRLVQKAIDKRMKTEKD